MIDLRGTREPGSLPSIVEVGFDAPRGRLHAMEQQRIEKGGRGDGRENAHDQHDDDQLDDGERARGDHSAELRLSTGQSSVPTLASYRLHGVRQFFGRQRADRPGELKTD